jgi:hypothetical protein
MRGLYGCTALGFVTGAESQLIIKKILTRKKILVHGFEIRSK